MKLITSDKEVKDIVTTIHLQDSFPFIYNIRKSAKVKSDYLDPGHNIDNFKAEATVAVEF